MKYFVFLIGLILSVGANSSTVDNVLLMRIHMYEQPAPNGGVFINIGFDRTGDPCPGNDAEYFIDLNSDRGKLLYSHAHSAFIAGYKVKIEGTGACGSAAQVETIRDFQIFRE